MKKALSFLTVMLFTGVAFAQTYNTKVHFVQGGNKIEVESGGTVEVKSGGTLSVASGGTASIAGSLAVSGASSMTGALSMVGSGVSVSTSATSSTSVGFKGAVVTLSTRPASVGEMWFQTSDYKLFISTKAPAHNDNTCALAACYKELTN